MRKILVAKRRRERHAATPQSLRKPGSRQRLKGGAERGPRFARRFRLADEEVTDSVNTPLPLPLPACNPPIGESQAHGLRPVEQPRDAGCRRPELREMGDE